MSKSYHVHFGYTLSDKDRAFLQAHLSADITYTEGETPPSLVYRSLIAGRPSEMLLDAHPDLEALVVPFAGIADVTTERMRARPHIALYNVHHNAPATAEMALTLLLSVAKFVVPSDREFRRHDWVARYAPYPLMQLRGKNALILGYGTLGRYLADLLRALGMRVLAVKRTPSNEPDVYTPDALEHLLPDANALFICLPATEETYHLMNSHTLHLLPRGAILINVGRASVVDPHALYDALKEGHLYGAGLDVWYHYPDSLEARQHTPPADVPFHELDNVVMTPHRGGGGGHDDIEQLRMQALAEILNQLARGETPPHRVLLERGY